MPSQHFIFLSGLAWSFSSLIDATPCLERQLCRTSSILLVYGRRFLSFWEVASHEIVLLHQHDAVIVLFYLRNYIVVRPWDRLVVQRMDVVLCVGSAGVLDLLRLAPTHWLCLCDLAHFLLFVVYTSPAVTLELFFWQVAFRICVASPLRLIFWSLLQGLLIIELLKRSCAVELEQVPVLPTRFWRRLSFVYVLSYWLVASVCVKQ